jgi:hypothetical protein
VRAACVRNVGDGATARAVLDQILWTDLRHLARLTASSDQLAIDLRGRSDAANEETVFRCAARGWSTEDATASPSARVDGVLAGFAEHQVWKRRSNPENFTFRHAQMGAHRFQRTTGEPAIRRLNFVQRRQQKSAKPREGPNAVFELRLQGHQAKILR